jgi:tRNA pseudouridine55 synthase
VPGGRARNNLSGVLLLDKPVGLTSNAALQRVRALYGGPKAGHTGTLDPLASGLLPVCFGEATKFSSALLDSSKRYEATLRLGFESSTGDAEGDLKALAEPSFDDVELIRALRQLTGHIQQRPPMYSAVKFEGRPLYRYAREGRVVERRERSVEIQQLDVLHRRADTLRLSVVCSKGTYIRVLAEDLGRLLGCGAYVVELRRTDIGPFSVEDAVPLCVLERGELSSAQRESLLLPVDSMLCGLPRIDLTPDASRRVVGGLPAVAAPTQTSGLVRLYVAGGKFIGLGEAAPDGTVVPKRLVASGRHVA